MKQFVCLSIVMFCLVMSACSPSIPPNDEPTVSFTAFRGYYYRGARPASDTTLFFHTGTQKDFDALFTFIADHNPEPTIPASDLSAKKMISVVKYDHTTYDLQATRVTLVDNVLKVYYTSKAKGDKTSATFATSLIFAVNANYQKILFIENGAQVQELTP